VIELFANLLNSSFTIYIFYQLLQCLLTGGWPGNWCVSL